MEYKTISATKARNNWFELLNLVYFRGKPFVIKKNNLPIVKLVPIGQSRLLPAQEVRAKDADQDKIKALKIVKKTFGLWPKAPSGMTYESKIRVESEKHFQEL